MSDKIDVGDWVVVSDSEIFAAQLRLPSKECVKWYMDTKALVVDRLHDQFFYISFNPRTVEVVPRSCISMAYCDDSDHKQWIESISPRKIIVLAAIITGMKYCPFCGLKTRESSKHHETHGN